VNNIKVENRLFNNLSSGDVDECFLRDDVRAYSSIALYGNDNLSRHAFVKDIFYIPNF
jgi:hypothetical protein